MQWYRAYDKDIDDDKYVWIAGERACNAACNAASNDAPNVAPNVIEVLGVMTVLHSLANRSPKRGVLLFAENLAHNAATLAKRLGTSVADAQNWLDLFTTVGELTLTDFTYEITDWNDRQFISDDSTARANKSRKQKKNVSTNVRCNVTPSDAPNVACNDTGNVPPNDACNAPDTDTDTDTEGEGKESADAPPAPSPPDDEDESEHLKAPLVLAYRNLWRNGGIIPTKDRQSTVAAFVDLRGSPDYSADEALEILKLLRSHEPRLNNKPFCYVAPAIREHLENGTKPGEKGKPNGNQSNGTAGTSQTSGHSDQPGGPPSVYELAVSGKLSG